MKILSIVIPCYNEEKNVKPLYDEISLATKRLDTYKLEIIFVNDGSRDNTAGEIKKLADTDHRIVGLILSRNFGHQPASTAGIDYTTGDAVILIDADLQDPPSAIVNMVKKWETGFDVVYGVRNSRKGESFLKKLTAKIFYRLIHFASNTNIPVDTGDFRLISRRVVEALKQMPERSRFIRGMVSWTGFNQTSIYYDRNPRYAGETNYTYRKMFRFAIDAITSFSSAPLVMATWVGIFISFFSFMFIAKLLFQKLTNTAYVVSGWTSMIVVTLFLGGVQLFFLGVIGEYLARMFTEVKQRPIYLIQDIYGQNKQ